MREGSLAPERVLALLAATPARIDALTAGLDPDRLRARPGPDVWCANEVLAHLRACADVWGGCIAAILAEDEPTLRAVNPRTWIGQTDYAEQDFRASLRAFAEQRAALLAVLEPLSPAGWGRGATVTGAGRPLRRTVTSYAEWMASHERPHVKQIGRTVEALRA